MSWDRVPLRLRASEPSRHGLYSLFFGRSLLLSALATWSISLRASGYGESDWSFVVGNELIPFSMDFGFQMITLLRGLATGFVLA